MPRDRLRQASRWDRGRAGGRRPVRLSASRQAAGGTPPGPFPPGRMVGWRTASMEARRRALFGDGGRSQLEGIRQMSSCQREVLVGQRDLAQQFMGLQKCPASLRSHRNSSTATLISPASSMGRGPLPMSFASGPDARRKDQLEDPFLTGHFADCDLVFAGAIGSGAPLACLPTIRPVRFVLGCHKTRLEKGVGNRDTTGWYALRLRWVPSRCEATMWGGMQRHFQL